MTPNSEREVGLKVLDRNGDPVLCQHGLPLGHAPGQELDDYRGLLPHRHRRTTRCCAWSASWRPDPALEAARRDPTRRPRASSSARRARTRCPRRPRTPTRRARRRLRQRRIRLRETARASTTSTANSSTPSSTPTTGTSAAVGTSRSRVIASGNVLHELDIQNLSALLATDLAEWSASGVPPSRCRSSSGRPPPERGGCSSRRCSRATDLPHCCRATRSQISYSTRSERLARDVQQLLLEFGSSPRSAGTTRRDQGRHLQPA